MPIVSQILSRTIVSPARRKRLRVGCSRVARELALGGWAGPGDEGAAGRGGGPGTEPQPLQHLPPRRRRAAPLGLRLADELRDEAAQVAVTRAVPVGSSNSIGLPRLTAATACAWALTMLAVTGRPNVCSTWLKATPTLARFTTSRSLSRQPRVGARFTTSRQPRTPAPAS